MNSANGRYRNRDGMLTFGDRNIGRKFRGLME